jgi:hypothetical protein
MYEHQTFSRGVKGRTVVGGTVQFPITVTIDGRETELTLPQETI